MDLQYFHVLYLVILVTSCWSFGAEAAVLNDYILDYQTVDFDHGHLRESHSRAKREADPVLRWSFTAYNRTFHLTLQPSTSVFAPDHDLVVGSDEPVSVDTSHIYDGQLDDVPYSSAHLAILSDSVMGHIEVPGDTRYHIEPASKHLKDSTAHTIIYPEKKMNLDPYKHLRQSPCGIKEHYEKLNEMSQPEAGSLARQKREAYNEAWWNSPNKYSEEVNTRVLRRRKRAAPFSSGKTCFMFLRADKLLYDHILSRHSSSGLSAAEKAKEEILSMFSVHVNALNRIYGNTIFQRQVSVNNPPVRFTGVQFQLQRTKIFDNCEGDINDGYCTNNLDVSNFLDLTARENHNEYCLVHTFTYRDFIGGTLGLAWVAKPESGSSGICGRYTRIADRSGATSMKSLNTGVVTFINFKQDVPPRVSQLTFAHEVGHNFGSEHDPTSTECAPYGTNFPDASKGNYIMFASAAQGNLPNNDLFSTCSRDYISKVLETLGTERTDCFKASNQAFCGNKVVEQGEDCDCGYEDECTDICCEPRRSGDVQNSCKLKPNVACSPSKGRCCSNDCRILNNTEVCQTDSECQESSRCDGTNPICPPADDKQNFTTFCQDYSKVCDSGQCQASVCQYIGWEECMLSKADGASDGQMCYESCRASPDSECISSIDAAKINLPVNKNFRDLLQRIREGKNSSDTSLGIKKPPGAGCDAYLGYCDILSKCRKYDAEGPFKQLTDLIFDPMNFQKVADWITEKWWAVLLMCVGFFIFMGVFVWVFKYNTPRTNPKKRRQQPRAAQSQGQNPRQQNRPRQQPDKRGGVYSVDVPMQERRGGPGYGQGHVNQGYQHSGHPQQKGQHFDRISQPRRY
ncbi:disintegrin and metalloproteinase domain-containing protein 10 [Aplysia californica]|uniref:ADAM10 endopeptidase n=1 Tax=Aplysia californica TaxID=6500 RepID=A0ABM0JEQ2_APLCA|nr:disintegrin and metalloproteinase domain-containing protein 10 [Aplysia californica]